jgi:hypothetical protein
MPGSTAPTERESRSQMIAVGVVTAVVVAAAVAVPAILGALVAKLVGSRLRRREWLVVAATGAAAIVLTFKVTAVEYLGWVKVLYFGGDRLDIPWVALGVFTATFTAVVAAVTGTPQCNRVVDKILHREHTDGDLMPNEHEIKKLKTAKVNDNDKTIRTESHSLQTGGTIGDRWFPVGRDRDGRPVVLGETEIKTHGVILGSTGSGKTEAIKMLAGNLMDLGWNVVMLDLKEDTATGGLRDFCRDYSTTHAIKYQELALSTPDPTCWFNPLYLMSPDEAINAILSLQSFDDGYWQAINRTMIGQVVTLFYDAHKVDPEKFDPPSMYDIGHTLRQPDLRIASREMRAVVINGVPGRREEDFSSLGKPSDDDRKSAAGLGARIINMYESEAGRKVLRPGGTREVIDVTENGMCYIGLNTLGLSELARVVSTSVLLRLAAFAGARTTGAQSKDETKIAVIIDEANWIDRKNVQNLLSRARSAGIAVFLATQGANDWNDENGQDWEKIVNNVNVGIIMRQGGSESAELCADFIGKRKKKTLMAQVMDGQETGAGSVREIEDYYITPDELRQLKIGQAILRVGVPQQRLLWTWLNQRDPRQRVN